MDDVARIAAWVSFWRHRTGRAGAIKAMHLIVALP